MKNHEGNLVASVFDFTKRKEKTEKHEVIWLKRISCRFYIFIPSVF